MYYIKCIGALVTVQVQSSLLYKSAQCSTVESVALSRVKSVSVWVMQVGQCVVYSVAACSVVQSR